MSLVIDLEIAVLFGHVLRSDVLYDRLVRDDPELATKNPRAHRWRPQHSLFRWLNCCNSFRDDFPLIRCIR